MDAFPQDSIRGKYAAPIAEIANAVCDEVAADPKRHLDRIRIGLPEGFDTKEFPKLLKERLSMSGLDFIEIEVDEAEAPRLLSTHFSTEWAE